MRLAEEFRERTKRYASAIVQLYVQLPRSRREVEVLGHQLLRSGTSVGAHCREGHRSRSDAELISKYEGALQELDETMYWLELLVEAEIVKAGRLQPLMVEANEIISILVASVRTIKRRRR